MEQQKVETLFKWLDETTTMISEHFHITYLEAIKEAGDVLFEHAISEEADPGIKVPLENKLKEINLEDFKREEVRKAFQLTILKGMKGATQQQHYMTPDAVSIFIGYLMSKFIEDKKEISLFDPACGTGNLLTAVLNQLPKELKVYATGSEVDSTLIQLAFLNANLQEREIEFHHQDSLGHLLVEPQDVIVSDLPVGYYPNDEQAKNYELHSKEGHSYAHHLFIEQSLRYTKPGGYLFFLVPVFLFNSDQSDMLHEFLHKYAHIQAVIQLPSTMFKKEENAKFIFVLQKKGKDTKPPKKVLMAQLPSFKNVIEMDNILKKINAWFKEDR